MKFNKPRYIDKLVKNPSEIKLQSGEVVSVYSIGRRFERRREK